MFQIIIINEVEVEFSVWPLEVATGPCFKNDVKRHISHNLTRTRLTALKEAPKLIKIHLLGIQSMNDRLHVSE